MTKKVIIFLIFAALTTHHTPVKIGLFTTIIAGACITVAVYYVYTQHQENQHRPSRFLRTNPRNPLQ